MPPRDNPLKLNSLQLKTLTLLQELAKHPETHQVDSESGTRFISQFPQPHGNHFHLGSYVVSSGDATGLRNEGVWKALERKGLAKNNWPVAIGLTKAGEDYATGLREKILHGSDH